MYTVYCEDIKKYIIEVTKNEGIMVDADVPELRWRRLRMDMEGESYSRIILCIKYMFEYFNIACTIRGNSHICVNNQEGQITLPNKLYHERLPYMCHLNKYPVCVTNSYGVECYGLLLFLIDPLEFVKRSLEKISACDDVTVRTFLLDLKCRAENIESMHIKCTYIMTLPLIDDVKKLVIDQYIALVINRDKIMLGSKKLKM